MALKFKIVETTLYNGTVTKTLETGHKAKDTYFNRYVWRKCFKWGGMFVAATELYGQCQPLEESDFQECIEYLTAQYEKEYGKQVKSVKETLL